MGDSSETSVATAIPAPRERPSLRDWIERLLPYASVLVLFIALSVLSPYFLTIQNLSSVCRMSSSRCTRMSVLVCRLTPHATPRRCLDGGQGVALVLAKFNDW